MKFALSAYNSGYSAARAASASCLACGTFGCAERRIAAERYTNDRTSYVGDLRFVLKIQKYYMCINHT